MSDLVKIEVATDPTDFDLGAVADALGDLRPLFGEIIEMRRELIDREFQLESWIPGSGGMRPWKPTMEFGTQPRPASTLQRSGRLRRAWLGGDSASITRIGKRNAAFGVDAGQLPYAPVHRGSFDSTVTAAQASVPERIKVTKKMRGKLGAAFGVYLRKDTTHIVIPRRPHAGDNPEARSRTTALASRYVLSLADEAA